MKRFSQLMQRVKRQGRWPRGVPPNVVDPPPLPLRPPTAPPTACPPNPARARARAGRRGRRSRRPPSPHGRRVDRAAPSGVDDAAARWPRLTRPLPASSTRRAELAALGKKCQILSHTKNSACGVLKRSQMIMSTSHDVTPPTSPTPLAAARQPGRAATAPLHHARPPPRRWRPPRRRRAHAPSRCPARRSAPSSPSRHHRHRRRRRRAARPSSPRRAPQPAAPRPSAGRRRARRHCPRDDTERRRRRRAE